MAENKRIPQLPYNGVLLTGAKFPFYDESTDTTYHINAEDFLGSGVSPDSIYNPELSYEEGAIVVYRQVEDQPYQVWISEEDDNLGNIPGPGSTFWTLGSKSQSGLVPWVAGVFVDTYTTVLKKTGGAWALYYLENPTRPFNSTDFYAELTAGDWLPVGVTEENPETLKNKGDWTVPDVYPNPTALGYLPEKNYFWIVATGAGTTLNGNFWPDDTWLIVKSDIADDAQAELDAKWYRRA